MMRRDPRATFVARVRERMDVIEAKLAALEDDKIPAAEAHGLMRRIVDAGKHIERDLAMHDEAATEDAR